MQINMRRTEENYFDNIVLLTVLAMFAFSALRLYYVPPILDLLTALLALWLPAVAIGIVASCAMQGSRFLSAGLFVLMLAFFLAIFPAISLHEPWRIVASLEFSPTAYVEMMKKALIFELLPVAAGLALCVVGYAMKGRSLRNSGIYMLLTVGGFLALWGTRLIEGSYGGYLDAVDSTNRYGATQIMGSLQALYAVYCIAALLWITVGAFLMVRSICLLRNPMRVDDANIKEEATPTSP